RRVQGRMSDGIGTDADAVGSGRGALTPPEPRLPRRGERRPAGLGGPGDLPARSRVARSDSVPRVLQWRHGSRDRREPPDRMDRAGGETAAADAAVRDALLPGALVGAAVTNWGQSAAASGQQG